MNNPNQTVDLTPQQRIALWAEVVDACEQLLLAGLRREVGPDGDVQAAYRRWEAEARQEHDRGIRLLMEGLSRRGAGHAR